MNFWKNKKVLVTGGAGFIGSYVCELLAEQAAVVTVADNLSRGSRSRIAHLLNHVNLQVVDLFNPENCSEACRGQDIVMNLAAKVTGIEYNRFHTAEMFENNMKLQMNVLKAAAECGVKHFLQVSTACIYPHDARVPTPEAEGERGMAPEPTNEGYGYAKFMGEKLAKYYADEKPMRVIIARPFNAYGPRDYFEEGTSHVIPALMKRILDGQNPVIIWGSGEQSRAFVHARDIARGMLLLTEKAPLAQPVNIGHDQEIKIKDLFRLMCKVLGKYPFAFFDKSRPDGYPRRAADTSLLKQTTGFVPAISLEEGLCEMRDFFLSLSGRPGNTTSAQ